LPRADALPDVARAGGRHRGGAASCRACAVLAIWSGESRRRANGSWPRARAAAPAPARPGAAASRGPRGRWPGAATPAAFGH